MHNALRLVLPTRTGIATSSELDRRAFFQAPLVRKPQRVGNLVESTNKALVVDRLDHKVDRLRSNRLDLAPRLANSINTRLERRRDLLRNEVAQRLKNRLDVVVPHRRNAISNRLKRALHRVKRWLQKVQPDPLEEIAQRLERRLKVLLPRGLESVAQGLPVSFHLRKIRFQDAQPDPLEELAQRVKYWLEDVLPHPQEALPEQLKTCFQCIESRLQQAVPHPDEKVTQGLERRLQDVLPHPQDRRRQNVLPHPDPQFDVGNDQRHHHSDDKLDCVPHRQDDRLIQPLEDRRYNILEKLDDAANDSLDEVDGRPNRALDLLPHADEEITKCLVVFPQVHERRNQRTDGEDDQEDRVSVHDRVERGLDAGGDLDHARPDLHRCSPDGPRASYPANRRGNRQKPRGIVLCPLEQADEAFPHVEQEVHNRRVFLNVERLTHRIRKLALEQNVRDTLGALEQLLKRRRPEVDDLSKSRLQAVQRRCQATSDSSLKVAERSLECLRGLRSLHRNRLITQRQNRVVELARSNLALGHRITEIARIRAGLLQRLLQLARSARHSISELVEILRGQLASTSSLRHDHGHRTESVSVTTSNSVQVARSLSQLVVILDAITGQLRHGVLDRAQIIHRLVSVLLRADLRLVNRLSVEAGKFQRVHELVGSVRPLHSLADERTNGRRDLGRDRSENTSNRATNSEVLSEPLRRLTAASLSLTLRSVRSRLHATGQSVLKPLAHALPALGVGLGRLLRSLRSISQRGLGLVQLTLQPLLSISRSLRLHLKLLLRQRQPVSSRQRL